MGKARQQVQYQSREEIERALLPNSRRSPEVKATTVPDGVGTALADQILRDARRRIRQK